MLVIYHSCDFGKNELKNYIFLQSWTPGKKKKFRELKSKRSKII